MNVQQIIEWCNLNSGFIQCILTLMTIIISIIAIIVSINTSRLPYKKKIKLKNGFYYSPEENGIYISVVNVGNREVHINNFCISIDKRKNIFPKEEIGKNIKLSLGEEYSIFFDNKDLAKSKDDGNKLYCYFEDVENTKKYKYIGKIKEIL